MGKARDPRRPLVPAAAGAAHCRVLCVVGVCYGRALAGRQEAQRAGQVAPPGLPPGAGADLVRHALFRPDPPPCPGPTFARAEALGTGMSTWSWPSPSRFCIPRSSACSPTGTTTTSPWPWTRTWTPWSATTAGRGRLPRPEPGDRPRPPPGRGLPWSTVCPPPGTRSRSSSAAWGRSTRRAAPGNLLGLLFPRGLSSPTRCSAPSSSTGCCGWRGSTTSAKTPSRCAPMDFVDLDAQGALTLVAATQPRWGAACWPREARPLPAGWQASA